MYEYVASGGRVGLRGARVERALLRYGLLTVACALRLCYAVGGAMCTPDYRIVLNRDFFRSQMKRPVKWQ